MLNFPPKWHDPSQDELSFANELLEFHFQSAVEDLLTICQMEVQSETGTYILGLAKEISLYVFFSVWLCIVHIFMYTRIVLKHVC